ncbi:DNA methyltransferase [Sphingobium lignivorans]|uniref:site-specific DNA-methyltransferase (adenine-specific) n=1 Tax=Sphingobium lignivorans TaxID=2735886 RepID=A0ABR6NF91_9SPHN|nr:DNA methyltransferase [Sphingobium lignivorans]MBB5985953.1 site-specific DNA-methyltransferase (adenine-specific) [Sphingobium lignivorans]
MSSITLYEGDNRESLRRLIDQGVRVHSVVTDPPYGLVSTVKRFGKEGSAAAKSNGPTGVFKRASGGFMNQQWDASGIERDPEFWKLIYDILLPGGYVLAFSSPRTGHWQACAMEMAGFVMHPFFGWVYGTGMPKGHKFQLGAADGWQYGAQATKPALEPIYFAQRAFSEKNGTSNWCKHGVGGINIDGCRVETVGGVGRIPANLLHDGSADVVAMFPDSKGQLARSSSSESRENQNTYGEMRRGAPGAEMEPRGDSGSAARFFNGFPLSEDDIDMMIELGLVESIESNPIFYHAKAGKADRAGSKHPTVKPKRLMQWLCRLVTPPGGTILDPFAGSGTTGAAAQEEGFDCILMEADLTYVTDIRKRFGISCRDIFTSFDYEFDEIIGGEGASSEFDDILV